VVAVAVAVLVALGGLVALAGGGRVDAQGQREETASGGGGVVASSPGAGDAPASGRSLAPDAAAEDLAPGGGSSAVPPAFDHVVRSARIDVTVARGVLDDRFEEARALATALGGYVERSETSRRLDTLVVRVPSARTDDAMEGFRGLGRLRAQSETGQDVGAQIVDLDARIRNLSAQEAVLQDIMRRAETIADTITVNQQLFAVREQIEQLQGRRRLLENQTTFSTITLTLRVGGAAASVDSPNEQGRLAQAWDDAWEVAAAIVAGTIVVLGAVVPLGLLALGAWLVWLAARRRRPRVDPVSA
jgi:hypothetical protein